MALLVSYAPSLSTYNYGYSGTLLAQVFKFPSGYDRIDEVQIPLVRIGTVAGNVTVSIYATSGGVPTGSALVSATLSASSIATSGGTYYTFDFTDLAVSGNTKYAIVLSHGGTSSGSTIAWWNANANGYADGSGFQKVSGGSWSDQSKDFAFKVYGYLSATAPTGVTTGTAGTPTETSCAVNSNSVGTDGGSTITQRGVCYNTSPSPTIANSKVTSAGTTGSFNVTLTPLVAGTTYYFKAYATNGIGTSYGSEDSFTTAVGAPDVTTGTVSNLGITTATLAGNVTDDHGATVTTRGVVVGTSSNPAIGGGGVLDFVASSAGEGSFTVNATGLSANTAYHYRAYAINGVGTSYGSDATFTTNDFVQYWAQQFVAGATGTITEIQLYLRLAQGSSGTPTLKIYSDSADSPNAVLATIPLSVTNSSYQWITKAVSQAVVNATKYWLVLENPYVVAGTPYHVYWGAKNSDAYASGLLKYKKSAVGSSWTTYASKDACFKVKVQPSMTVDYDLDVKYKKRVK